MKQTAYLKRFNKIFPIFYSLSGDLLFYVAIDTLFYTMVKGFTPDKIVFLTTISSLAPILLGKLIIKIIQKIGNTKSVRLAIMLLIVASTIITFANSYVLIGFAKIISNIAFMFKSTENAMLKNNLVIQNKEEQFTKILNSGNTGYAIITMIISFIAGYLFNINNYLPMYLCIIFCVITFIISLYMKDLSANDIVIADTNKSKIKISKIIWVILIFYGLFFSVITVGQANGKLLIQYELTRIFDISKTATYLSLIVAMSRISRVIGNISFKKVYDKFKDKVSVILCTMITLACVLLVLGYFINVNTILKFTIMAAGFCIILAIRDPFRVYIYDLALKIANEKERQAISVYLDFARKIGTTIVSLIATAILTKVTLIYVISCLIILAVIELALSIKIYKRIVYKNRYI